MPHLPVSNEPYALFSNGTGYVSSVGAVSTYSFIQNTGLFTIVGRVFITSMGAAEYGILGNTTTNANKGFYLSVLTSKALNMIGTNGSSIAFNATSPSIANHVGKWLFFAVRGNGTLNSSIIRFSTGVDGSITHNTPTTTVTSLSSGDAAGVLGISALTSAGSNKFNGGISSMAIWNRNLSDAEVEDIFYNDVYSSSGCVSRWEADNVSTLNDSVGGYNGTLNSLSLITTGPLAVRNSVANYPYSLSFDSTASKYVLMSNNAAYAITSGGARIRFQASRLQKANARFFCIYASPTLNIDTYINSSNKIELFMMNGASIICNPSTNETVDCNKWHELFCTYDGTVGKIYLDGLLVKQANMSSPMSWSANPAIFLGCYGGGGDYTFSGNLTDFSLYSGTITAQDVLDVYKNGKVLSTEVANWGMTDGSGSTLTLTRGTGGNGTLTATVPYWSAYSPGKPRLSTGYVPTGIPNLRMWARADRGLSSSPTGGVSVLSDLTCQGQYFVQNTATLQPISVNQGINNLPSLQFDGSNDGMSTVTTLPSILPGTKNEYSYYIVAKPTAITNSAPDATAWLGDGLFIDASGYLGSLLRTDNGNQLYAYHFDSAAKLIAHPVSANEVYLHSVRFGSGVLASRKNNGSESTLSVGNVGASVAAINIGYGYITSRRFTGLFSELIFFNRKLSDAEDTLVRAYLSARYSIA